MGARFLGAALIASILWFAWRWHEYTLAGTAWRVLLLGFAGATIGKLIGIAAYQLRKRWPILYVRRRSLCARPQPPRNHVSLPR